MRYDRSQMTPSARNWGVIAFSVAFFALAIAMSMLGLLT